MSRRQKLATILTASAGMHAGIDAALHDKTAA
jgi:hypothetical protein